MDTVRPIQPHERVLIESGGECVRAEITSVTQRNWARTASGRDAAGAQLFLKQFVGRDGNARRAVYDDELRGLEVAQRLFTDHLELPRMVGRSEDRLIACYEHLEFMPIETMLRRDPKVLTGYWPGVVERLAEIVDATAAAETVVRCADLPSKERPYTSNRPAVNFKGFEVRNVAVVEPGRRDRPRLAAFDLGRPYLGPVEEVAARLLVSTLLLNWGFPLSRFVTGPPFDLADVLRTRLAPCLVSGPVSQELEREERARRTVSGFGSRWVRVTKKAGLATIGSWYFKRARGWCRAHGLA